MTLDYIWVLMQVWMWFWFPFQFLLIATVWVISRTIQATKYAK